MIHAALRQYVPVLALGLLLVGCASDSTRPDPSATGGDAGQAAAQPGKNEIVEKRAMERWEYLIGHQAEKAYDYLSPGYRSTKSRDEYSKEMNNRPVQWTKVYPYSQSCEKPDVCILNLQIEADASMPGVRGKVPAIGFVEETWIRTRGKWYYLPATKAATGSK